MAPTKTDHQITDFRKLLDRHTEETRPKLPAQPPAASGDAVPPPRKEEKPK